MITWGSADHHKRISVKRESRRHGRRQCHPGVCPNPCTHAGMVEGEGGRVCLMIGCQFHVAMWVRDPNAEIRAVLRARQRNGDKP